MKQKKSKSRSWFAALPFAGFFVVCLFLAPSVPATEDSHGEGVYYIVRKGDTLWAISGRFYHDPFLWPFVWAHNPYIDNPHWIFPGNRIFLADVQQSAGTGGIGTEAVAGEVPKEVLTSAFSVPLAVADAVLVAEDAVKPQGWIVASDDNVGMVYEGTEVFLNMVDMDAVGAGDVYQVLKKGRKLKHPKSGKKLGTLYHVVGYVKVVGGRAKSGVATATILKAMDLIEIGDLVIRKDMPADGAFYSKPSNRRMAGYVVANAGDLIEIAQHDVCVIDKGIVDGVEVGDTFWVLKPGKKVKSYGKTGGKIRIPAQRIGTLVVIRTEKVASTALVTRSESPFQAGAPIVAKME